MVIDRREISGDAIRGYYFSESGEREHLFPIGVLTKFDDLSGWSRIYTNGPIDVFRREGGGEE